MKGEPVPVLYPIIPPAALEATDNRMLSRKAYSYLGQLGRIQGRCPTPLLPLVAHRHFNNEISGVFDQPVFNCAHAMLGIDNILFSVDEPFQDSFEAMDFLNSTQLSKEDREKLAHGNAERLLKLSPATSPRVDLVQSRAERLKSSIYALRARTKSKMGRALVSVLVK